MFLHLKIHKCKQLDLNILHRFKYNMCSFFCKWFYSIRIFCWVFRWPKQGVMVISLQLEQYEKEENTRLGGIPMFGTEKKLAQVACLQRMVQVVSKGQSLLRSVGHCSSPGEEGWHEQSDTLCTGHTAEIPPWRWTVILGFVTVTAKDKAGSGICILG